MPKHPLRRDRYGRPLPTLAEAAPQDMTQTPTNMSQRKRILQRLMAVLDEHYPSLLRRDVYADVTLSFHIVEGTLQEDILLGVVWRYPEET